MSTLAPLENLPRDVTIQILELLEPRTVAAFEQLSHTTRDLVLNSPVWASIASRYLALAAAPTFSARAVHDAARSLACHWAVAAGLFVAGVPVHRRSGFVHVMARGGAEIALHPDSPDACYVFGGRFAARAIPASIPALAMHFAISPKGPRPLHGLKVRLLHAAEPRRVVSRTEAPVSKPQLTKRKTPAPPQLTLDEVDEEFARDGAVCDDSATEARVRIRVNDHLVAEHVCTPAAQFDTLCVHVPSHFLVTKPALNVLSVEYAKDSTAGYWLRDVAVSPTILPLPALAPNAMEFPLAAAELSKRHLAHGHDSMACSSSVSSASTAAGSSSSSSSTLSSAMSDDSAAPPSRRNRPQNGHTVSTSSTRRSVSPGSPSSRTMLRLEFGDMLPALDLKGTRAPDVDERIGKLRNNRGKRPKHMYHQKQKQNYRAPRSPRH